MPSQPNYSIFTTDCEKFKERLAKENLDKFYLFGYGSLLWSFNFDYERKIYGYCNGFRREFWLLSDDHRGTPKKLVDDFNIENRRLLKYKTNILDFILC